MLSQSIFEIFRFTDVNGISPIVLFTKKESKLLPEICHHGYRLQLQYAGF